MIQLKSLLKRIPGARRGRFLLRDVRTILDHRFAGSPVPPPHLIKLCWLANFQESYDLKVFIETGTYMGHTVSAMLDHFEQIYTIELDNKLWREAQGKFKDSSHVHMLHGDSGEMLSELLPDVSTRCLFWLDGHFSGGVTARGKKDTPIVDELSAIASHHRNDHVILIDDARHFNGSNDYPTFEEVRVILKDINPDYTIRLEDDIIQAYPAFGSHIFRLVSKVPGATIHQISGILKILKSAGRL